MASREQWITWGINMILRARWTYLPAAVAPYVQRALLSELEIRTIVSPGRRQNTCRVTRVSR